MISNLIYIVGHTSYQLQSFRTTTPNWLEMPKFHQLYSQLQLSMDLRLLVCLGFGWILLPMLTFNDFEMQIHTLAGDNTFKLPTTCEPYRSLPLAIYVIAYCKVTVQFGISWSTFDSKLSFLSFTNFISTLLNQDTTGQARNGYPLASCASYVSYQHRFRDVRRSKHRTSGYVNYLFLKPVRSNSASPKGVWMENGRCVAFVFVVLIICLRWNASGGFMGDLVFNGGNEPFFVGIILPKASFDHFRRKIRYLGWKPAVSNFVIIESFS